MKWNYYYYYFLNLNSDTLFEGQRWKRHELQGVWTPARKIWQVGEEDFFYNSQPEASDVPVQETPAIAGSRGGGVWWSVSWLIGQTEGCLVILLLIGWPDWCLRIRLLIGWPGWRMSGDPYPDCLTRLKDVWRSFPWLVNQAEPYSTWPSAQKGSHVLQSKLLNIFLG